MDLSGVRIETSRLLLRAVDARDCGAIYREFNDTITRYMGVPTPRCANDTAAFIAESQDRMRRGEEIVCAIIESDQFAGCAGVHELNAPAPELGIWIVRGFQGAGRGREAVAALRDWTAAHCPRAPFLRYPVDRANAASRRIAERLGGTVESTCERATADGRRLDIVEYHIPR